MTINKTFSESIECGASRSIAGRESKFTPEQQTIIVRTTGLPLRDGKESNVVNLLPVAGFSELVPYWEISVGSHH